MRDEFAKGLAAYGRGNGTRPSGKSLERRIPLARWDQPGGMFALTRNRLVGSNFPLSWRSRW